MRMGIYLGHEATTQVWNTVDTQLNQSPFFFLYNEFAEKRRGMRWRAVLGSCQYISKVSRWVEGMTSLTVSQWVTSDYFKIAPEDCFV